MKFFEVINRSKENTFSVMTGVATSMFDRMLGLMFKKSIDFDGLYIKPCNSIHTFFCYFPLDIYFLNKENKVIKIISNIRPWRMTRVYFKAASVLEYKAGFNSGQIEVGDVIEVKGV